MSVKALSLARVRKLRATILSEASDARPVRVSEAALAVGLAALDLSPPERPVYDAVFRQCRRPKDSTVRPPPILNAAL